MRKIFLSWGPSRLAGVPGLSSASSRRLRCTFRDHTVAGWQQKRTATMATTMTTRFTGIRRIHTRRDDSSACPPTPTSRRWLSMQGDLPSQGLSHAHRPQPCPSTRSSASRAIFANTCVPSTFLCTMQTAFAATHQGPRVHDCKARHGPGRRRAQHRVLGHPDHPTKDAQAQAGLYHCRVGLLSFRCFSETHGFCSYWSMYFDASPRALESLTTLVRRDPRVIRWTMLKQGDKVEDLVYPREKTVMRVDYLKPLKSTSASWSGLGL